MYYSSDVKKCQMLKENDGNILKFLKKYNGFLTYENDCRPLPHNCMGGQMESSGS